MPTFPHLQLRDRIAGLFRGKGGGPGPTARTQANLLDRQNHAQTLVNSIDTLANYWDLQIFSREEEKKPNLPNPDIIPVFLQVDPDAFDVEALKAFGIEIISEEEDGYIIGAATRDFTSLKDKIDKFVNKTGTYKDKAAQLWQINEGFQWRVDQILSEELSGKWDTIMDDENYIIDVGIACYLKIPDQPVRTTNETDIHYDARLNDWYSRKTPHEIRRDETAIERQTKFEEYVELYGGEILSDYEDFEDSFSCRVRINGIGLKDITLNYQFIFEIVEYDPYTITDIETGNEDVYAPEILAPPPNSPKVCIIDSGIQEGHRLLANAIDNNGSHSFLPNDNSTADLVTNGGHGTRVAGAVLYPREIPKNGSHQLFCLIQNARILNGNNELPRELYPPTLMRRITDRFTNTKLFNMSINSHCACKLKHMSQWASAIDKIMFEKSVLFIVSAGNISRIGNPQNPGIQNHISSGNLYPIYLLKNSSRISNPAQSCFAITVGSICINEFDSEFKRSIGATHQPSSFSRTGLGLWGMIKPDVVEYGGDFAMEKSNSPNISNEQSISPELVKSTAGSVNAVGKDMVGTSFAAPKVTHVLAKLQETFPNENVNLYRALLIQSARLPESIFFNPTIENIRSYGHGIPDLNRAIDNSNNRVTLTSTGRVCPKNANVYSVKIPDGLRNPGDEYDILIEVTLSYMAKPRRTRRKTRSYLSAWLDWHSSKLDETHDQFCARIIKDDRQPEDQSEENIQWSIRNNPDHSEIVGLRKQDSSLQKAWCILKSYTLPSELSLAVVGHPGWSKELQESVPYSIVVSFEALGSSLTIYEMIRIENEVEIEIES